MNRLAIFIDGAYLEKVIPPIVSDPSYRIDFTKLPIQLAGSDELFRTYYYHCPPFVGPTPSADDLTRSRKSHSFFDLLNRISRFQVRLGRLAPRGRDASGNPIFQQKRVDALLCVDMVVLALTRQISKAILISGDSDFMPAVEVVKQNGVLVELWHGPRNTVHDELWKACDDRQEIEPNFLRQVQFFPPAPRSTP